MTKLNSLIHNNIEFKIGDIVEIKEGVPYFSPRTKVIVEIVSPEKMETYDGRTRLGLANESSGFDGDGMAYLPEDVILWQN